MERKLYRGIMTPSMVAVVMLGSGFCGLPCVLQGHWMHIAVFVVFFTGLPLYCGHLVKTFATDQNQRSHMFYRWFNEVPVFLLIAIVILVVVKPF